MSENPLENAPTLADLEDAWDEDDEDYDEEDGDDDIDAEAQEMARRLNEQLMEDMRKAAGPGAVDPGATDVTMLEADPSPPPDSITDAAKVPPAPEHHIPPRSRKEEAAMVTIKVILSLLERDAVAHSALSSAAVPNTAFANVLDALKQILASGQIAKETALALKETLVSLAGSESLFGTLRHSNASQIQLNLGKRKREHPEDAAPVENSTGVEASSTSSTKHSPLAPDLHAVVSEAVHVVTQAISTPLPETVDSSLIASIKQSLHYVFLFSVTSSARGEGPETNILQEISGLIQVLGVLSGIQIGQMPPPAPAHRQALAPWGAQTSQTVTDIGTMVYPCMIPACRKTFIRLYSLRNHERSHSVSRPYHCTVCPASFLRNHDLKRHKKMHEKVVFKCAACQKQFSRRDAIKRHKNANESRGEKGQACFEAEILEVEHDSSSDDALRDAKRTKMWSGIANESLAATGGPEEGEIPETVIANTQTVVMQLHPILRAYVSKASGSSSTEPPTVKTEQSNGQLATLASVIARAQSQSLPTSVSEPATKIDAAAAPSNAPDDAMAVDVPPPQTASSAEPGSQSEGGTTSSSSLSMYGLSDEQARLLEEAITNAALAAQAQAEAEADQEEEEEEEKEEEALAQDEYSDADADADPDMEVAGESAGS